MSDHLIEDSSFINSIVGEGTRFRGELDLNGLLRIDGDYSGVIRTPDKVLVGKNGRAECAIYAGTIVIGGAVKGDVFSSEKIIILSTGMVIGNLTTPRLIVEEGVVLDGTCTITKEVDIKALEKEHFPDQTECESADQPADTDESGPLYSSPAETNHAESTTTNQSEETSEPQPTEENKVSAWNG